MGLEVKVILHGHEGAIQIAHVWIQQIAQGEGTLRDYKVEAYREDMHTGAVIGGAGKVEGYDRNEPVWNLLLEAIAAVNP